MILRFWTDRSWQTVQSQIRLLLDEQSGQLLDEQSGQLLDKQSGQGLQCLQFRLHLLDALLYFKATLFKF